MTSPFQYLYIFFIRGGWSSCDDHPTISTPVCGVGISSYGVIPWSQVGHVVVGVDAGWRKFRGRKCIYRNWVTFDDFFCHHVAGQISLGFYALNFCLCQPLLNNLFSSTFVLLWFKFLVFFSFTEHKNDWERLMICCRESGWGRLWFPCWNTSWFCVEPRNKLEIQTQAHVAQERGFLKGKIVYHD